MTGHITGNGKWRAYWQLEHLLNMLDVRNSLRSVRWVRDEGCRK